MTTYAYGAKPGTFASIRQEAKEPWRGITALLNDRPYLVIGKDGDTFVLEGEDGDIQRLESFQWTQATDASRLVSASRHPETAFTKGSIFGQFTVGDLAYEDGEWYIRNGNTRDVLPLEWMVERLEQLRNDPNKLAWEIRAVAAARYGIRYDADYKCPMCGSRDIAHARFDEDHATCENCGHHGDVQDFLDEPPDYDDTHGEWYPEWEGPLASIKTASTFSMQLPPQGIHFRTHAAFGQAGITAQVQYPPLPGTEYENGLTGTLPGGSAIDEMDYTTEVEDAGMNPTDITIQVTTEDGQEEQAKQIINQLGGLRESKVALEESGAGAVDVIDSDTKAIKCPRCGSHTLRAFGVQKGQASMKCLTCGNEFKRPAMNNPESKIAEDAHKFVPGARVQMTHPQYKGQRGSIVDYSGKHADLGEEQYEIQLDSGDKITNIPESAFNKIKSARVDNESVAHIDATRNHFVDTMTFTADSYPDGKGLKMDTIPLTEWDDNDLKDHYDPDAADQRYDEPEEEEATCPMCGGPGTSLGALGSREYHRCRNCGMDWSRPNSGENWDYGNDPDNLFGQDKPGQSPTSSYEMRHSDSLGNKLEAGRVYLMSGKNYTVPDLVRILNLEHDKIEAAIASDAKGAFPIVIEAGQESEYKFEPVKVEDGEEKEASGWKLARKNFSTKEQRELIDENPGGRARNIDKLDLSGTHYELKSSSDDPDFLWG